MARKNTQITLVEPTISDIQERSIELEILGKSVTDISKELDVSRKTIYEWRKDQAYVMELNRRRYALQSEYTDRIRMIAGRCIQIIESALEDGSDPDLAFRIAKEIGLFNVNRIKSDIEIEHELDYSGFIIYPEKRLLFTIDHAAAKED